MALHWRYPVNRLPKPYPRLRIANCEFHPASRPKNRRFLPFFSFKKAPNLCILTNHTFPHFPHKLLFCVIFFAFAQHLVDFLVKFSTLLCGFFSRAEKFFLFFTKIFLLKSSEKQLEKQRFNSFIALIWLLCTYSLCLFCIICTINCLCIFSQICCFCPF